MVWQPEMQDCWALVCAVAAATLPCGPASRSSLVPVLVGRSASADTADGWCCHFATPGTVKGLAAASPAVLMVGDLLTDMSLPPMPVETHAEAAVSGSHMMSLRTPQHAQAGQKPSKTVYCHGCVPLGAAGSAKTFISSIGSPLILFIPRQATEPGPSRGQWLLLHTLVLCLHCTPSSCACQTDHRVQDAGKHAQRDVPSGVQWSDL